MTIEYIIELAILLAPIAPAVRAAASRAYRRVFPMDALRLTAGSITYIVAAVSFALIKPEWLRIPAALSALFMFWLFWRARPGFGVKSGLPPGSLDPLPVRPWRDPEYYAKQAVRHGDVFKMSQFGQPMVCIVGLEKANKLLLQHDSDLVAPPLPFNRFIEGGYLRYLPEETHANYRRFFRTVFHSEAARDAEPRIASIFYDGFSQLADDSANRAIVLRPAVMRMMFVAWSELFYGIGQEHPDFPRLRKLFHVIDIRKARWARRKTIDSALAEIEAIMRQRAGELASSDLPASCFLAVLARDHPETLSDRTVLGNLIYIMQVTWGDVTGLLLWVFRMLSDNRQWATRLAGDQSRDLAQRIVQETLRLEQSESRYRRALTDIEIDGFRIPKNWLVRICVRESHRNEETFPNPLVFDPDRFSSRPLTRSQYAPFGAFRLACIGEELTKSVGSIFALELVSNFDWRVIDDGAPSISSWTHNAPYARMSVEMFRRVLGETATSSGSVQ